MGNNHASSYEDWVNHLEVEQRIDYVGLGIMIKEKKTGNGDYIMKYISDNCFLMLPNVNCILLTVRKSMYEVDVITISDVNYDLKYFLSTKRVGYKIHHLYIWLSLNEINITLR